MNFINHWDKQLLPILAFFKRHQILSWTVSVLLIIGILLIGVSVKSSMEMTKARATLEVMLKENHDGNQIPRSKLMEEESGPFSGIVWYDYTFSSPHTLAESKRYLKATGQSHQQVTLENCPIVYRVILRPPTKTSKRWTGQIYLDTNQQLSGSGRSSYVQALSAKSLRDLN
ncbi:hypothetical protein C6Y11_14290 [Lactiplantibacillus pentosus]|uniref:hypothetical protein n=2 Tax=Lactiplantibacillus pentosus TaxID=1589 RepID=UPI000D01FEA0|nr:hypothetical protein [Lactiplantibacillus pentosus]MCT3284286.1 hypothetical protein [Lactiplantibacillus pentosus]MCT3303290.1 hypothetical protein [Lactiplantibacillus pentosus]PRO77243.1 hypothetical protein C6Y11_14290 [Lactiplantibacillus pentosus]PRO77859.1 hypothetical protein C6Y09_14710 [Lactiplantibacillus pentosus]PRO88578.1 hypothetical protein C6Y12_14610 [Lactiplantibacillus pentosus]